MTNIRLVYITFKTKMTHTFLNQSQQVNIYSSISICQSHSYPHSVNSSQVRFTYKAHLKTTTVDRRAVLSKQQPIKHHNKNRGFKKTKKTINKRHETTGIQQKKKQLSH